MNRSCMFVLLMSLLIVPLRAQQQTLVSWRAVQRGTVYEPRMIEEAAKSKLDPRWIWIVGYLESKFIPTAQSGAGAYGMMQFMPATAARFGIANVYDPHQSIIGAAKYLGFLSRRYHGNFYSVLAGYNAGEGAVDAFLMGEAKTLPSGKVINPRKIKTAHGVPPYPETMNYVNEGARLLSMMPGLQERDAGAPVIVAPSDGQTPPEEIKAEVVEIRPSRAILFEDEANVAPTELPVVQEKPVAAVTLVVVENPQPKTKSVIFQ